MRSFLLFLLISLLLVACAKSYIELRYNEGNIENVSVERDVSETDISLMREAVTAPTPQWLKKTVQAFDE